MKPTVLVVSSVHPPDDARIRHKLVETLRQAGRVRLAMRSPGPADVTGISYEPLEGGRLRRTLAASWKLLRGGYDVASVHDPELLPALIAAALLRRRVVFDVHEDVPAQILAKPHVPRPLRRPAAWLVTRLLRLAERVGEVTLAEPNYAHLFRREHRVFPNYLKLPGVSPGHGADRRGAVYLGDITEARGIATAIRAVGLSRTGPELTLIGRCAPELRQRLEALAADSGAVVRFLGFQPPPDALDIVAEHAVALSPLHDTPNYRNSLPTKLLEYLALGVPVVASDLPGSRRLLTDAAGVVWVEPGDAAGLAAGIDEVLGSESIAAAARAGAESVRLRFRWPDDEVRAFYLASA